jgi:hypothetical protein
MRLAALVLVLFAVSAVAAQADGDPASDWLYTQKVFIPFDVKAAKPAQQQLLATVEGAWKQQFKIKVAVIGNAYDLGAVPSLWRKPQTYARFLGAELAFLYKQRLLIVMPNGFGFYWQGHDAAGAYATLGKISIAPTADGLVDAAHDAVVELAKQDGVTIEAAKPPANHTNRDRLIIVVAAVVLIGLALLGRLALRRRKG